MAFLTLCRAERYVFETSYRRRKSSDLCEKDADALARAPELLAKVFAKFMMPPSNRLILTWFAQIQYLRRHRSHASAAAARSSGVGSRPIADGWSSLTADLWASTI